MMIPGSAVDVPVRAKKRNKKNSMWRQTWKRLRKDKIAMIGLAGVILLILVAIFAPYITRYAPDYMDLAHPKAAPSADHIMGTDLLGRDYFSRLIYGGRYSLTLGICSSLLATVIGVILGSIAGYYGKWADAIIMRFCDILQSIPPMMISIVVSLTLGNGYVVTILALAIGGFSFSTRMTRAQILSVRGSEYLSAAKTINCSVPRIIFKHTLPNILSPMLLDFTMKIAQMIQLSAGLSVIGLGVQVSTPEWGAMLAGGRDYIRTNPHLVIFPGIFIFAISLFINMFGDSLRDALDPKLKK